MKMHKLALGIAVTVFLLLLQSAAVFAQDQDQDDNQGQPDPPSRVARLNHSDGSVSFQPGGEGDWVQAVPNRPLTTGDNLWADKDSRAELHVGSTALRLGSESSLTFLDLDDQTTQLKLSQGSLIVRVRHLDDGDNFEIDTPNMAFIVQRIGEYRIDVNANGDETDATVWHGRGEVTGGGSTYTVVAGQYARFAGTDELDHDIEQIPGSDDLDNWAFSRDEHEDHSESANYISTEMTGYEDLDDYGSWHYVADYGPVWSPRGIAGDWAPYREGHWAWVEPWGWTWVEDEPWGFAPFHYGRWAYVSNSWCWVPGPVVVRPVYAPALVAFVGGGGFGVSVGFGGGVGVGWFPLGPREVYVPWYHTSPRYVTNVNITNTRVNEVQVTNVYNSYRGNTVSRVTYVNQHVNNGVTVVSRDTFVNARPVQRNVVRMDQRQMEQAQVVRAAPVQPVRQSVVGAGAPARFAPPARILNRQVVATRNPTPPRQSFEQRQTANVRTVNPGTPQPAGRMGNEPTRPNGAMANQPRPPQPVAPETRPNTIQRMPQTATRAPEAGQNPQVPRPGTEMQHTEQPARQQPEDRRPAANAQPRNVPRPPAPEQRQAENARPEQPTHPLVRQVPPVQEHPEQQKNEEQKFNTWQQQHQAAAPRAPQPPPAAKEAPRSPPPPSREEEKPKK